MSEESGSVRVVQVRSAIGRKADQKATLKALGIRRMNQAVVHRDSPEIRGMIFKVSHLVTTEKST